MSAPKTVVLNVDDQDVERYVKTRDLTQNGFVVIEARTGAEALRIMEEERPPVVLLDVQLPDITGYEVCTFIKHKWPETMVLQTSATFTSSQHRTIGLDSGADSYLVQPAEPLELAAAINALLRIRKSEDELRTLNATLEERVAARTMELVEANSQLKAEMVQRSKAEAALVQSQKMEAVGQLTGGLAHDFNNLLTAVVGNLDMIRSRATDARISRMAENAFKAAERGSKLTAQLLAFSRTQKLATAAIDLNDLVSGLRELVGQSLGANVVVKIELTSDLPAVMADANQLELAILNLSINARDAMPDGGTLTIATQVSPHPGMLAVAIRDTGTGMPPDVIKKAFDPFFTTKPPGQGTGLGLSQVYGIMRQIGGNVEISSEVGNGTTVLLSIPQSTVGLKLNVDESVPEAAPSRHEKVFIVDDDDDVRDYVTGVLSELGYRVNSTSNASEALYSIDQFQPDLLLIDFAMPGINGADVARAAQDAHPKLKVLFVSGFADTTALDAAVGNATLLRKPFRPAELAAAVRQILD